MKKVLKGFTAGFFAASVYYLSTVDNSYLHFQRSSSILWGKLTSMQIPENMRSSVYNFYGKVFDVNFDEIDGELNSFPSISAFFTRKLKPGVREWSKYGVSSPVDGRVLTFGESEDGKRIEQVKGKTYSIQEFIGHIPIPGFYPAVNELSYYDTSFFNPERSASNKLFQCVIYLAPGDYHWMHSPVNWNIRNTTHYAGGLYSVRVSVAQSLDRLFCINERIVMEGSWLHGFFSMTAVGAWNVGSINLVFDKETQTNRYNMKVGDVEKKKVGTNPRFGLKVKKSDELAYFNFGSTVVLLFEAPHDYQWHIQEGQKLKMGELIGSIPSERIKEK